MGESGTILRTTDGGATWKATPSGTTNTSGWVAGGDGLIYHTITGGEPGPLSVSSASLTAPLAVNSLASLFGSRLAPATASADVQSLPVSLGGISLKVRDSAGVDRLARLLYASPTQINFEVPAGTTPGDATLEVVSGPVLRPPLAVQIRNLAPGLFTLGNKIAAAYAVRVEADGQQTALPARSPIVLDDRPVYLILYGTGIRNRSSLDNVQCTIAGITVPVEYAGPSGSNVPGLDQVNVRLTAALKGSRDGRLVLTVDGVAANTVLVNVR